MASETPKWQIGLLAVLAVVAVALAVTIWPRGTADITGSGADRPQVTPVSPLDDPAVPPALGLEAIGAAQVAPLNNRDLFRFGEPGGQGGGQDDQGAAVQQPGEEAGGVDTAPAEPEAPAQPAGPPPIPLRFVGYAETPGTGKVAALSDGRFTYHGREGDVIEGRWRIVTIGVESLVIERVDGSGRQTLRLQ